VDVRRVGPVCSASALGAMQDVNLAKASRSSMSNLEGMPLILTSNEAIASDDYDWEDVTGVQYHYPNGYRSLIRPGERFVYYRGVRRAGNRRGNAEYFGTGLIGEVWRDDRISEDAPKKDWQWFCRIDNYVLFNMPVAAKINGTFF
jgi:hypothetical protein